MYQCILECLDCICTLSIYTAFVSLDCISTPSGVYQRPAIVPHRMSSSFNALLSRPIVDLMGRCCAAIRLSRHPERSGHEDLDITEILRFSPFYRKTSSSNCCSTYHSSWLKQSLASLSLPATRSGLAKNVVKSPTLSKPFRLCNNS